MPSETSERFPPNSSCIYDVACLAPMDDGEIAATVAEMRLTSTEDRIEFVFMADGLNESDMRVVGAIARAWPTANIQFCDGP